MKTLNNVEDLVMVYTMQVQEEARDVPTEAY